MWSFMRQNSSSKLNTPSTNQNTGLETVIESITCPITGDVMQDPVQGNDGHTYERSAITEWLNRNPIPPQTRQPMSVNDLKVNASIRFLCDKYHSGGFGNVPRPRSQNPPIISDNNIKLLCNASRLPDHKTHISFTVDEKTLPSNLLDNHLPQDIVLVIDRSGSMNLPVEAKDANGDQLENGMSIQDVVNHAAKTVVKTSNKNTRIAIVVFDNRIETLSDFVAMNDINKSTMMAKIDTIKPGGQTNIWGATETAINLLDSRDDKQRNGAIILLTDGSPNISPARGEVDALRKLRIKKNFTSPIYTFGFGYNLAKDLLYDMAKIANGGNGHIPDGGMIATVFCNFIATILSTVVVNLQLHIKSTKDNRSTAQLGSLLMGDFNYSYADTQQDKWMTFDLGTVQNQQSRDIILNTSNDDELTYFYTYKIGGKSYISDHISLSSHSETQLPTAEYLYHINRYNVIEALRMMLNFNRVNDNPSAMAKFHELVADLESQSTANNKTLGLIKNLKGDATNSGQIALAVSNMQYFQKWGEFYIDQLSRSLNQQIKPNFKDEGCLFGGEIFEDLVDKASDIFDNLPPPVPSLINTGSSYTTYRSVSTPINMSSYNDPGGGCFTGDSLILLASQNQKLVANLTKGDEVLTLKDPYNPAHGFTTSKIVCILKTNITDKTNLVTLNNNLKITPYHPVLAKGNWSFPNSLSNCTMQNCNAVYTIVLEHSHTFNLNGYWVIGLGHNYKVGILAHDYFGSNKIIEDLKKLDGWESGFITINPSYFIRDYVGDNRNIIGIQKPQGKTSSLPLSPPPTALVNI